MFFLDIPESYKMSYQVPPRSTTWTILESVTLVTLDVIIFFGNLIICYVIYKRKPLQTMTNMLVVSLATNDLVTACITLPMAATTAVSGSWMFDKIGCEIFGFFSKYLVHVSLYIITLIAVNRYVRILHPNMYRCMFTAKRTMGYLGLIWGVPAILRIVPVIAGSARFVFVPPRAACSMSFYNRKAQKSYTIFATVLFIAIPMTCIVLCYAAVSRFVRKHRQRIFSSMSTRSHTGDLRVGVDEVKVTYTLFAVVFTFVICWLPVSGALLVITAAKIRIPPVAVRVLNALVALSSACTPFVYGFFNRPFRHELKKVFSCLFRGGGENRRGLEMSVRDVSRGRSQRDGNLHQ